MKKIFCRLLALLLLAGIFTVFTGCEQANQYSEEEHLQRVSERIESRFMGENSDYTSYKVFPLYDENEELGFFVAEFEPYGYAYIMLRKPTSGANTIADAFTDASMYQLDAPASREWYPYTVAPGEDVVIINEDENYTMEFHDARLKLDEEGNYIRFRVSHFKAAAVGENERRYLLKVYCSETGSSYNYIPAVKRGDSYLNLVSWETLDRYTPGMTAGDQAVSDIAFFAKPVNL